MMEKKSGGILAYDGKVIGFLNKTGEIILLNIVFLLCCLPVITIGPALTSLYYATMKSIRRERGYPIAEFWNSMKRTMKRGMLFTLISLCVLGALLFGRISALDSAGELTPKALLYDFFILLAAGGLIYLFPVLSRFEMKLTKMVKLSFVMSIRFLPITAAVLAGSAGIGWMLIYILPMPCLLFVPGLWCLAVTFLMEKALLAYMPEAKPGEEQWYDKEKREKRTKGRGNGERNEAT